MGYLRKLLSFVSQNPTRKQYSLLPLLLDTHLNLTVRPYCWWYHILWPQDKETLDATEQLTSSLLASFRGTRMCCAGCWREIPSTDLPSCELYDVMGVNRPFRLNIGTKEQHWPQEFSPYKPPTTKISPTHRWGTVGLYSENSCEPCCSCTLSI